MDEIGRWSFLKEIGRQLNLRQGKWESKNNYASRVIFSAVSAYFLLHYGIAQTKVERFLLLT